jgi:cellulose 1,4-beta-cellobiosidase
MPQHLKPARESVRARLMRGCCALALVAPLFLVAGNASAQQHVANPFVGATQYLNPDYANEVGAAIAQTSDTQLKAQMTTVAGYPTAVWLDKMAAINGGSVNDDRLSLSQHITEALAQQTGTEPVVITLVIYDLPQRDCAALASNGELSIAANPPSQPLTGIATYEQDYITPIFNILKPFGSNPNLRFVLVIEPDSLPNLVTNTGLSFSIPACVAANGGQSGTASVNSVYAQGIQFALNTFHALPNVYQYLDIGHSAWLGWPSNMGPAVTFYSQVVRGTTAGVASIDGFISDTANYTPTKEPFMTANESIGGNQLISADFYQFNPFIDEADYDAALYTSFVNAGFPSTIGFLIDTSRNGWGASNRPAGPSTSTDLNTFVDASKIDQRNARGQWCNQSDAGLGTPPTVNPTGFFSQLQAFVWIKPPGESDGTYATSSAFVSGNADENCDPAHSNALANNTLTGALPNPPSAGLFFPAEFTMLVQNALPVVPASGTGTPQPPAPPPPPPATASFKLSTTTGSLSVAQGASGATTVAVAPSGGFTGSVAFSVPNLPAGVTATFAPTSSQTSTKLTLAAASTAAAGIDSMTIKGTSGTLSASTTLSLTVTPTSVAPPSPPPPAPPSPPPPPPPAPPSPPPPPAGGSGPVTATGAAAVSGAWFDQDNVNVTTPDAITAFTLTITVPSTDVSLNGSFNTVGGQITDATTTGGGDIVFTFTLKAGQQLSPGSYTFAAQMDGNGSAVHNAAGDKWTLSYTAGGVAHTQSGTI